MWKSALIVSILLAVTPAMAQQPQPDLPFMQRAIVALQGQRNQALDAQTIAEAKLAGANEDLTKANAKIKQLEDELAKKPEVKK